MMAIGRGILHQKTFSIEWKIERFFADCKNVGDFHKSVTFPIRYANQITIWHLEVHPRIDIGEYEENSATSNDSIGIYLCFESKTIPEVTVDCRLSIVSTLNLLSKSSKGKTFKSPKESWGWAKFVNQDFIKDTKNGALIDDTLTILCDITIHHADRDVTEKLRDYDNLLEKNGKVVEDYEKLLENNYFSDVIFIVQNNKMYLHRNILMCRNSVFRAMFAHDERPGKKQKLDMEVVRITDFTYEVMKEMIRFIYSGKVENIEKIAKDLLIAADKYSIIELKALCEKTLYAHLTIDNAVEYLTLTDICETIHLRVLIIGFMATHYKDMVKKPGFAELSGNVMYQIIQAIAEEN